MLKALSVVFVAGVCLLDAGPVKGQMATTTKPYDVTTLEGYREWAIRYAAAYQEHHTRLNSPEHIRVLYSLPEEPTEGWPAVADPTKTLFSWEYGLLTVSYSGSNSPTVAICSAYVKTDRTEEVDRYLSPSDETLGLVERISSPPVLDRLELLRRSTVLGEKLRLLPNPPGTCRQLKLPPQGASVRMYFPEPGASRNWYGEFGNPDPVQRLPEPTPTPQPQPAPQPAPVQNPVGRLEVPANGSFQSGIGFVSGWVCDAETVAIVIDGGLHLPPVSRYIGRGDTEEICGDQNNGFITQWNWNLMGDGTYTAALVVDGQTLQTNTFTVTTLGEEFVRGAAGECSIPDFPSDGESATFRWQEAVQGLVLVPSPTE